MTKKIVMRKKTFFEFTNIIDAGSSNTLSQNGPGCLVNLHYLFIYEEGDDHRL